MGPLRFGPPAPPPYSRCPLLHVAREEGGKVKLSLWIQGARPKTLGAAVSPVLVGTAAASRYGAFVGWRALLALIVSVALQVGVNFANDYSDGVRGVDVERKGPVRLTASGLASPGAVKTAA
ncbi:MAG: 1,4-dihydroxy-2-naphthoate polyprenyltransferase, partial [Acidimicrobiaceae bacterium]